MSTGIRLPPVTRQLGGAPSPERTIELPSHPGRAVRFRARSERGHKHGPRRLAQVALLAGGAQVAHARGPSGHEWHDVVDVEHDARRPGRATAAAAAAAKPVASEDPKAELGGEGIAGSPCAIAGRGVYPARRTRAPRSVTLAA
jgi:hypothetical protein